MNTGSSLFTEVIEEHLSLKKQNAHLNSTLPLSRFDTGDPLDRFPGGPVSPEATEEDFGDNVAQLTPGPDDVTNVGDAMTVGNAAMATPVFEGAFRPPLEPLGAMTPMLSLVSDVDDDLAAGPGASSSQEPAGGSVLRFPGGVGPRDDAAWDPSATMASAVVDDTLATATLDEDRPVIVIDADEPLVTQSSFSGPIDPATDRPKRPSFFSIRRRKGRRGESAESGWFSGTPRDFHWDD